MRFYTAEGIFDDDVKDKEPLATPKQLHHIEELAANCAEDVTIRTPLDELTPEQASEIIDELSEMPNIQGSSPYAEMIDDLEDPIRAEIGGAIHRAQWGDVGLEQPEDEVGNAPLWVERIP